MARLSREQEPELARRIEAARQAGEKLAATGRRHNRLMFWLSRRMTGTSALVTS